MNVTLAVRAMALSDPQWQSIEPKRELVFPVGEPAGNDERRWRFTPEDLAAVAADFSERTELAPAYYCHGEDPSRGKMAAGWIDRVELAPDGLYAFIRYTEKALAEIRDGAWGYRSPGFDAEQDAEGYWRPRRLSEVSLVNDPAIAGMPPIKAAIDSTQEPAASDGDTEKEESQMADSKTVTAAKKQTAAFDKPGLLALIRETYAMPEAVSDEMLIELVGKAFAGAPEPEMDLEKEKEPENPAAPPVDVPALASAKPRIELVEDGSGLVAAAERAGKLTPAMKTGALKFAAADPNGFASFVAAAPVVAPAVGQVVSASASDRNPKPAMTWAEKQTAVHRIAAAKGIPIEAAKRLMEA